MYIYIYMYICIYVYYLFLSSGDLASLDTGRTTTAHPRVFCFFLFSG